MAPHTRRVSAKDLGEPRQQIDLRIEVRLEASRVQAAFDALEEAA